MKSRLGPGAFLEPEGRTESISPAEVRSWLGSFAGETVAERRNVPGVGTHYAILGSKTAGGITVHQGRTVHGRCFEPEIARRRPARHPLTTARDRRLFVDRVEVIGAAPGLGFADLATCGLCDSDADGEVEVHELITALNLGLSVFACHDPVSSVGEIVLQ